MSFNTSNLTAATDPNKDGSKEFKKIFIISIILLVGILGNLLALIKLEGRRTSKNANYTLLLRCLMANNLIGLTGVSTLAIANYCVSKDYTQWICAGWVIVRFFGLSSGCIAMVMSVDRYMASNHPLFYYKVQTLTLLFLTMILFIQVLQRFTGTGNRNINWNAIKCSSFAAAIITFLPFVGFGLYYNKGENKCKRYREAETLIGRAYAILFFIFGTLICIVIVTCNVFVIRALVYKTKTTCNSQSTKQSKIKFAKLMAFLSLTFVICWMPQMISIIFALKSNPLLKDHFFYKLADNLVGFNFALDPYVYVLSGTSLTFYMDFLKCLRCCRKEPSGFTIKFKSSPSSSTETEAKTVTIQLEK